MKYEFNIGDRVRIRDWDDMASEYESSRNCIYTPGMVFISEMRDLCGREFEITRISTERPVHRNGYTRVYGIKSNCVITTAMIEPVGGNKSDDSDMIKFICEYNEQGDDM